MAAPELPDMTVVTYPDYHLSPGTTRVLIIGSNNNCETTQDLFGMMWPAKPITLYLANGESNGQIDWLYYQSKIADIIITHTWNCYEWVYPIITAANAQQFFVVPEDLNALAHSLKLTHPGRVFHTVEDTVHTVIKTHT